MPLELPTSLFGLEKPPDDTRDPSGTRLCWLEFDATNLVPMIPRGELASKWSSVGHRAVFLV